MAKKKGSWKKILFEFGIAIFTALLVTIVTQDYLFPIKPLRELELKFLDFRFLQRGEVDIKDSAKVIIVEINQDTYDGIPAKFRGWPWPRFIFAKLIDNLSQAGVKAIGIDIIMSNPDRYSPAYDTVLANSIKSSGQVVVAGKVDIKREAIKDEMENINQTTSGEEGGLIVRLNENYGNIFFSADSSIGLVQIASDDDGVHRRYRPYIYSDVTNRYIPTFAFAILNKFYGLPPLAVSENYPSDFLLAGHKIPKFDNTSMLINFYGKSRSFPYYSFLDIIDDKEFKTQEEIDLRADLNSWDDPDYGYLNSGIFKDKIVLIGSSMPEDKDILPVSLARGEREGDNTLYGVEVHATVIQNILSGDFLEKQSVFSETALIFILTILIFFISSVVKRIKVKHGYVLEIVSFVITAGIVVLIYELSIYLFIEYKFVMAVVSPILSVVLGYFGSTVYHFILERRQNVVIKGMFSQYVSGALVNELIANPDKLRLGGEQKNLTILFSDIAGFTTFAEGKKPEVLVSFMNEFLNEMSEIILQNNGTLDKYLGDAVMAFWGAPLPMKDHSLLACRTALAMDKRLAELRKKWTKEGEQLLTMRIGINTGDVVVGNIGGKKRFDYTVMGDEVNLASRLEGANKEYKTCIMISDSTYNNVNEYVIVRELDKILVKGKTKATKVYELIGLKEDITAIEKLQSLDYYLNGLSEYKLKNFTAAVGFFEQAIKLNDKDFPSKVYLDRCNFYIENPPSEDWDGVFVLKTK